MKPFVILYILLLTLQSSYGFDYNSLGLNYPKSKVTRKTNSFDQTRLIFGGGIGLAGLNGGITFNISPSVGYRFTDRFHAGMTLGYNYFRQKTPYADGSYELYKNSIYTPSLYARYFPVNIAFIQVQPEFNFVRGNLTQYYASTKEKFIQPYNIDIPSFLVGGGYAQPLGNASYMMLTLMYDLVQNPNSQYYRRPVFGGGVALGLFNQ